MDVFMKEQPFTYIFQLFLSFKIVLPYSSGWPGTHDVDQAGPKLR